MISTNTCGAKVLRMVDNTSSLIHRLELLTDELIINKKLAKENELRFNDIFVNSNMAVTLVSESGKFLKSNDKLEKMLGYTKDELLNLTYQDITHIDDLYIDMKLAHSLLKSRNAYSMIKRYYKKDKTIIWVLLMVGKISNSKGELEYYLSQILDLTPVLPLIDIKSIEKARNSGDVSIGIWE